AEGDAFAPGPEVELGARHSPDCDWLRLGHDRDPGEPREPRGQVGRWVDEPPGMGDVDDLVEPHDHHLDAGMIRWVISELDVDPGSRVHVGRAPALEARCAAVLDLVSDREREWRVEPRPIGSGEDAGSLDEDSDAGRRPR